MTVEKDAVVQFFDQLSGLFIICPVNTLTVGPVYNYTLQDNDQTTR